MRHLRAIYDHDITKFVPEETPNYYYNLFQIVMRLFDLKTEKRCEIKGRKIWDLIPSIGNGFHSYERILAAGLAGTNGT
jgi:hypothetical protein